MPSPMKRNTYLGAFACAGAAAESVPTVAPPVCTGLDASVFGVAEQPENKAAVKASDKAMGRIFSYGLVSS